MSVTYLFCNSQFSDVTRNYSFIAALYILCFTDGKVIKMERLNKSQLRAQAVRLFLRRIIVATV